MVMAEGGGFTVMVHGNAAMSAANRALWAFALTTLRPPSDTGLVIMEEYIALTMLPH